MKEKRKAIDRIDVQINSLLDDRARLVKQIGKEKKKGAQPVYAPEREKMILDRIAGLSRGKKEVFPASAKINIFSEIFAASRSIQKKLTISFLGPEGTYTHLAAARQFSNDCTYVPASNITQVFRDVEKKRVDYGVVPIENSNEGIVTHTLDMFFDSECRICAELQMEISHNLLSKGKSMAGIRKIYSHPQALAQCRMWIEEHLPRADCIEVPSTTQACETSAKEKNTAAIASIMASKLYGLNVLEKRIEDIAENITRFLVIGNDVSKPSGTDKTTVMFSVKDRVGALHDMLVPFKRHSVNLTKIESRPSKIKAWEYVFFVDFLGHVKDDKVKAALSDLGKNCLFVKVLGSYPAAKKLFDRTE
ncbi:MAG: prephenate dehydratase [Elusimicrobia bacterium]|nr:prephenate dehydratase [Elusimicrobiota bacterium]